jgi:hypothetical protein
MFEQKQQSYVKLQKVEQSCAKLRRSVPSCGKFVSLLKVRHGAVTDPLECNIFLTIRKTLCYTLCMALIYDCLNWVEQWPQ